MICKVCKELVLTGVPFAPSMPLDAAKAVLFRAAGDAAIKHYVQRHKDDENLKAALGVSTLMAHTLICAWGMDGAPSESLDAATQQLAAVLTGVNDGGDNSHQSEPAD